MPKMMTRRSLLTAALGVVSTQVFALGAATMRAPYGFPAGSAIVSGIIPVATPGPDWTGFLSAASTGQGSGEQGANKYQLNRNLRGNGPGLTYPWRQRSTVNIAEPDGMWIDPVNNDVVIMGSTGDPNTIATILEEVVVIIEGGTPVVIPGWKFEMVQLPGWPKGVPGYRVKLAIGSLPAHAGKWGPVNVTAITRPYNGYEHAITKTFILDDFGAAQRQSFTVAPNGYSGSTAANITQAKAGLPFPSVNAALTTVTVANGAGYGPFINCLAGTHIIGEPTSGANDNPYLITVRAAPGLDRSQVIFENVPFFSNQFQKKFKTATVNGVLTATYQTQILLARNILCQSITQKTTYVASLKAGLTLGRYYTKDCLVIDDDGPTGLTVDPINGTADPDNANGAGGFGFWSYGNLTPDSLSGISAEGTYYAYMETDFSTGALKGNNIDHFRRNVNAVTGGDSVFIGAPVARGRKAYDGVPALDCEDLLFVNMGINMPCATPFKTRLHDVPTLGIEAMQAIPNPTSAAGTLSLAAVGASGIYGTQFAASTTSKNGFTIVTFKATSNDAAQTPVNFTRTISISPDRNARFVTGALKGGNDALNGATLGWFMHCIGVATTATINGVDYPLAANQAVMSGDLTSTPVGAAQVGDRLICFSAYHSDPLQYAGASGSTPNYRNHIVWNYRAWGPGIGNMVLITVGGNDPLTMSVDVDGNFTFDPTAILPVVRVFYGGFGGMNFASPPSVIDTVTMAIGDRILVNQNVSGTQLAADASLQTKGGVYVYNGVGQPLTRSADALAKGSIVRVTSGTQFGGGIFRLDLDTDATKVTKSTYVVDTDNVYWHSVGLAMFDSLNVVLPSGKNTWGMITQINADGLGGKLNRPLVDASGTPTAYVSTAMTRIKGIVDSGYINMSMTSGNVGQFTGTFSNVHFLYNSLFQGLLMRPANYQAPQDVVIKGTALGPSGLSLLDVEPRRSFYLSDIVIKGFFVAQKDYIDTISKTLVPTLAQTDDGLGLLGTARTLAQPISVPLDFNGNPRVIGGTLGVTAQAA